MIVSSRFLEDELRQCSKVEGVMMADSVETLGVDLRTRVKRLGAKEKSKNKEMQSEILAHEEEQGLPKVLHGGGGQEVVTSGYGTSKNVGRACCGDGSHRKIEIEAADGSSSSREEGVNFSLSFLGSVRP